MAIDGMDVTLREIYSGFANVPSAWTILGDLPPTPRAQDDGSGRDIVVRIPVGYHVEFSVGYELNFYDTDDRHCEIISGRDGAPVLVTNDGIYPLQTIADSCTARKEGIACT